MRKDGRWTSGAASGAAPRRGCRARSRRRTPPSRMSSRAQAHRGLPPPAASTALLAGPARPLDTRGLSAAGSRAPEAAPGAARPSLPSSVWAALGCVRPCLRLCSRPGAVCTGERQPPSWALSSPERGRLAPRIPEALPAERMALWPCSLASSENRSCSRSGRRRLSPF